LILVNVPVGVVKDGMGHTIIQRYFPTQVGGNVLTSQRVVDVILKVRLGAPVTCTRHNFMHVLAVRATHFRIVAGASGL